MTEQQLRLLHDAEGIVGRYLTAVARRSMVAGPHDWELEVAFVAVAAWYSQITGLERAAWQIAGVDAAVLTRAGL